nr:MAG TPA: hypothetical protein [Caudoviricetes sp.]
MSIHLRKFFEKIFIFFRVRIENLRKVLYNSI